MKWQASKGRVYAELRLSVHHRLAATKTSSFIANNTMDPEDDDFDTSKK
jgi:hypothetical protein